MFCIACGERLEPTMAFCGKCGAKVGDTDIAGTEARAPERQAPKSLSRGRIVAGLLVGVAILAAASFVRLSFKGQSESMQDGKSIDSQLDEAGKFYQKKNYAAAIQIWRSLADSAVPEAQLNLGIMYDDGTGVAKDPAQSAAWYLKAAKLGLANAQFNIGVDYLKGVGLTKDYDAGIKWISLAAKQGFPNAIAVMKEQAATNARASAPDKPHCHFGGVESPSYALSDGQCVNADGTAFASPASHVESVSPICRQLGDMLERISNYSTGNDYAKERQTETIKRNMDEQGCPTELPQTGPALSDERKAYLYDLCTNHTDRTDCDVYQ